MFEVKKHLIKVAGNRLYLPVSARLVWFRQEHPDWGIETKPIVIDTDKQYAVFEASVFNAEGKLMAKGTKMEDARGFPDYIEKAETGAIGRALAVCGFGTQFAPDLDEVNNGRMVDSPQRAGSNAYPRDGGGYMSRRSSVYSNGSGLAQTSRRAANGQAHADASESNTEPSPSASSSDSSDKDTALTDHACATCNRSLTKGQELLSIRKFGIALCPDCQKERRTSEAAV